MLTYPNFTAAYLSLLSLVNDSPEHVCSPRGLKIKESLGVTFRITDPRDRLPRVYKRDFSASYFVAESLWYLSGNNSTAWIAKYSSFWNNISDDGVTANSAYGARIFKPHKMIAGDVNSDWTQWQYVLDELARDNDSRRAVIHIRTPKDSIFAHKDVPCTLALQFFLRDKDLHLVVSMRSSDLILGIPLDVPAFTLFQELMANQLSKRLGQRIGLGSYTHTSNSLHIYENKFSMVNSILSDPRNSSVAKNTTPMRELPDDLPIDRLMEYEKLISEADDESELFNIVNQGNNRDLMSYYADWIKILASHRAGKLGLVDLQSAFLKGTSSKAYHFYKR